MARRPCRAGRSARRSSAGGVGKGGIGWALGCCSWDVSLARCSPAGGSGEAKACQDVLPCGAVPEALREVLHALERVWLYLRERCLSHRLLAGYNAVVDACCHAWNQLTPERLRSLTHCPYLQQVTL